MGYSGIMQPEVGQKPEEMQDLTSPSAHWVSAASLFQE